VFVVVVDPGVGSARAGLVLAAGGHWFVGPDNGLLTVVGARARDARWWRLPSADATAAPTFHGRDVFAPAAVRLARGDFAALGAVIVAAPDVVFDAGELARAIYVDHYGNVWSGLRAANLPRATRVRAGGVEFAHAETYARVDKGQSFWYVNSVGLLEIAVNRGSAAEVYGLAPGARIELLASAGARLN
jgi:S-adenosylmethionine hydrolase